MISAVTTVNELLGPGAGPAGPLRGSGAFADTLARTLKETGDGADPARWAAAQLVASSFIMPVLASMQDSPFLDPPFAPGPAEKRFTHLLHQQLADQITAAANFPLVDMIADRVNGNFPTEARHD